ncbi:MAG: hypothetical protein ABJF01_23020 [bacterium]
MKFTHRILGAAAVGILGSGASLHAQSWNFQGSTEGCFYVGSTPCTPAASGSGLTLDFLTFVASQFNVNTAGTFAGIGAAATPDGPSGNVNNLGSFALGTSDASYEDTHFLLDVIFTVPSLISPHSLFSAALEGVVQNNTYGGVDLRFLPSTQSYAFDSGGWTDTFVLKVNDVSLTPGDSPVALTGNIHVTSTPEPGTTALFATGLAGLIPVVRMRRRKQQQATT